MDKKVIRFNNLNPIDVVSADTILLDSFVKNPKANKNFGVHNEYIKPNLLLWIDQCSYRILNWAVSGNITADLVKKSFLEMIEEYGVPERIRIDNGSAFCNVDFYPYAFTGRTRNSKKQTIAAEMLNQQNYGLYINSGVHQVDVLHVSYNPRTKPIERFFRHLSLYIAEPTSDVHNFLRLSESEIFSKLAEHNVSTLQQMTEKISEFIKKWNAGYNDKVMEV